MAYYFCRWCLQDKPESEIPITKRRDVNGKIQGIRKCLSCKEKHNKSKSK